MTSIVRGPEGATRLSSVLLALDTSSPAVTVAVHDGRMVLAERTTVDARRHTELVAPSIVGVLVEAGVSRTDLTSIAVGIGPGPFTGLRIGLVTARTLGAALRIPVHGVCSLDVIAAEAAVPGRSVVVTDARRKEVYLAEYTDGKRTGGPVVDKPDVLATDRPAAGAGASLYSDRFPNPIPPEYPSAAVLAGLVVSGQADTVEPDPLYLRRPDATSPGPRKSVLAAGGPRQR